LPIFLIWWLIISQFIPLLGFSLIGWDNLHPEFNLSLNLSRSLSVSWQEYQGLGLLGGMGHGADFIRQLFLFPLTLFLPLNTVRFFWLSLMLLVGPIFLYLIGRLFFNKNASLVSAVFYLLNFATVQYFFVPFETFISFYGLFPLMIFALFLYLKKPNLKNLFIVFTVNLIGAPAFYVQTLFVVYVMFFSVILLTFLIFKKINLKKWFLVNALILMAHFYWFLPALWFSLFSSNIVSNSKINSIATIETFLMNKSFFSFIDIFTLRGFWLEFTDLQINKIDFLMPFWKSYAYKADFVYIGLVIFVLSIVGIFLNLKNKKNHVVSVLLIFLNLLCIAMLFGAGKLMGNILSEAFRSPFTKWSVAFSFTISLSLGAFVFLFKNKHFSNLVSFILLGMLIFQMKPVFIKGNLISENMLNKIPLEYFEVFEFFDNQPQEKRIANFPINSFWSWQFNQWGYRGSGFLWYGIKQPILDRAFDVWSSHNETFYWEISNAINQNNEIILENVLKKYDVSFILFDESVILPEENNNNLKIEETKNLLLKINAKIVFNKNFISVYELENSTDNFVYAPKSYYLGTSQNIFNRYDVFYQKYGEYIDNNQNEIIFPFSNLYNERNLDINFFNSFDEKSYLKIASQTFDQNKKYILKIPAMKDGEELSLSAKVKFENNEVYVDFDEPYLILNNSEMMPEFLIANNILSQNIAVNLGGVRIDLKNGEIKKVEDIKFVVGQNFDLAIFDLEKPKEVLVSDISNLDFAKCWERENTNGFFEITKIENGVNIKLADLVACAPINIGNLVGDLNLVDVNLPFYSNSFARPYFCIAKQNENDCLNEDIFYKSQTSFVLKNVYESVFLDKGNYRFILGARPSETKNEVWEISYQNPKITIYPQIIGVNFAAVNFEELTKEKQINVSNLDKLDLFVSSQKAYESNFKSVLNEFDNNCDVFKRGETQKQLGENNVIYKASNRGVICDYFVPKNVNTQKSYLLRIIGENYSGRSLKFVLQNYAHDKSDFETLLPQGKFDQTFSMMNFVNYNKSDYSLNFETRSFGREESVNEVKNVVFYDFPLDFFANWEMVAVNETNNLVKNDIEVIESKKYLTTIYKLKIKNNDNGGMLAFSQGYDKGWIAFFDFQFVRSQKLDSWKNGFLINKNACYKECNVIIFYAPQALQWFGFLVLIVVSMFLFFKN